MDRREFLKSAAAIPLVSGCAEALRVVKGPPVHRVRPTDPSWPTDASWARLRQEVGGRLVKLDSPLAACRATPASCADFVKRLRNPYFIGDDPALTQTSAWIDAWTSTPSVYAVAAAQTTDVVEAVNFARLNKLRLVVKGGGHSYQGTSSAPDSLLIWTRAMNAVTLHEDFVPQGCAGTVSSQPAVTAGAGAIWMQLYDAVTTRAGRYVQGGGCTTVGVAGLVQSGGFGSFSKAYGLAAAGLLEAEVVTADGAVRIANACMNPELFWALKGGGGGTFGVVTRVTLRTRELPASFGGVFGVVKARTDAAFAALIARLVSLYRERLFNPHWGEQIRLTPGNVASLEMVFQGLDQRQAQAAWQPLVDWVSDASHDCTWERPLLVAALPARLLWDAKFLEQNAPGLIARDTRPGAPEGRFFWAGNTGESGQVLHAYRSAWLPASLLEGDRQRALANALFAATRHWNLSLHFNKGLAGASAETLAAARDTAMNPAVVDAFALAIIASNGPPAFPGLPGHEPDVIASRRNANAVNRAMDALLAVAPAPGSYVSESDFFEREWPRSFWGSNHARLAAAKRTYDPDGLFFVHHGVGSEEWSADGFTRVVPAAR